MVEAHPRLTQSSIYRPLPSREPLVLRPIHDLKILIHPLWMSAPDSETKDPIRFFEEREHLYAQGLKRFVPKGEDDILLFLPNLDRSFKEWKKDLKDIISAKAQNPTHHWPDMYRQFKRMATNPKNVILGENIVFEENPEVLILRLANAGFLIGKETNITVGGEWLNGCVRAAVEQLLRLPQIRVLSIDKLATLTAGYFMGYPRESYDSHFNFFKTWFLLKGYRVTNNREYISIAKR